MLLPFLLSASLFALIKISLISVLSLSLARGSSVVAMWLFFVLSDWLSCHILQVFCRPGFNDFLVVWHTCTLTANIHMHVHARVDHVTCMCTSTANIYMHISLCQGRSIIYNYSFEYCSIYIKLNISAHALKWKKI